MTGCKLSSNSNSTNKPVTLSFCMMLRNLSWSLMSLLPLWVTFSQIGTSARSENARKSSWTKLFWPRKWLRRLSSASASGCTLKTYFQHRTLKNNLWLKRPTLSLPTSFSKISPKNYSPNPWSTASSGYSMSLWIWLKSCNCSSKFKRNSKITCKSKDDSFQDFTSFLTIN